MLSVPSEIRPNSDRILKKGPVPTRYHSHCHKWLRCHPDFCRKCHHPENNEACKLLSAEKLREKNQPAAFQARDKRREAPRPAQPPAPRKPVRTASLIRKISRRTAAQNEWRAGI